MPSSPVIHPDHASRGSAAETRGVLVEVEPAYQASHSAPSLCRYIFSYRIKITNHSGAPIRVMRRAWTIIDADGDTELVEGDGVVGQQPLIAAGESYDYASWCQLETPWGTMEGSYELNDGSGNELFSVRIGRFFLVADA
ncbi:MAG: Co2+/Mg2+ efflux protein ApaG [Planctomycetota bacterium]